MILGERIRAFSGFFQSLSQTRKVGRYLTLVSAMACAPMLSWADEAPAASAAPAAEEQENAAKVSAFADRIEGILTSAKSELVPPDSRPAPGQIRVAMVSCTVHLDPKLVAAAEDSIGKVRQLICSILTASDYSKMILLKDASAGDLLQVLRQLPIRGLHFAPMSSATVLSMVVTNVACRRLESAAPSQWECQISI